MGRGLAAHPRREIPPSNSLSAVMRRAGIGCATFAVSRISITILLQLRFMLARHGLRALCGSSDTPAVQVRQILPGRSPFPWLYPFNLGMGRGRAGPLMPSVGMRGAWRQAAGGVGPLRTLPSSATSALVLCPRRQQRVAFIAPRFSPRVRRSTTDTIRAIIT